MNLNEIEDDEFIRFLAGRNRVPMKEAELRTCLRVLKNYVEQGIVTVDTTVQSTNSHEKSTDDSNRRRS